MKEETGLTATRIVRKVSEFGFSEFSKRRNQQIHWLKLIFEMEVESLDNIALDPVEHQKYLWADEEEVKADRVGDMQLTWITPPNKMVNLEAFRKRRECMVR